MPGPFAPTLSSEITPVGPVAPVAPAPSAIGALADFGSTVLKAYGASQRGTGSKSGKPDAVLAQFTNDMQKIEAVRQQRGDSAAALLEKQVITRFAGAGHDIYGDEFKATYEGITNRPYKMFSRTDDEATSFEVQEDKGYLSIVAYNKAADPSMTDEEARASAQQQIISTAASEAFLVNNKNATNTQWVSRGGEQHYMNSADLFEKSMRGHIIGLGPNLNEQHVALAKAQWEEWKVGHTPPSGVSDDYLKGYNRKIKAIDDQITAWSEASSYEVRLKAMKTFALSDTDGAAQAQLLKITDAAGYGKYLVDLQVNGGADPSILKAYAASISKSVLAAGTAIDIQTPVDFNSIVTSRVRQDMSNEDFSGDISKSLSAKGMTTEDIPEIATRFRDPTTGETYSPKQLLALADIKSSISDKIDPSTFTDPVARQKYVEAQVALGSSVGMMGDGFINAETVTKYWPKGFFTRLEAVGRIDPDHADDIRAATQMGLNRQLSAQYTALSAFTSKAKGAKFNETTGEWTLDKYALAQAIGQDRANTFAAEFEQKYTSRGMSFTQAAAERFRRMNNATYGSYDAGLSNLQPAIERQNAIAALNRVQSLLSGGTDKGEVKPVKAIERSQEPVINLPEHGFLGRALRERQNELRSEGILGMGNTPFTDKILEDVEAKTYDTLYGDAESKGTPFKDVKVTSMTIGELKEFQKPSGEYGQWVKGQLGKNTYAGRNGLTSTPVGKYQFIGTTLSEVAKDMGLPDDTVFTEEVQDAMFLHYAGKQVIGVDDTTARRNLRSKWEGLQKVDDSDLDKIIGEVRNSFNDGESEPVASSTPRVMDESEFGKPVTGDMMGGLVDHFYQGIKSVLGIGDAEAKELATKAASGIPTPPRRPEGVGSTPLPPRRPADVASKLPARFRGEEVKDDRPDLSSYPLGRIPSNVRAVVSDLITNQLGLKPKERAEDYFSEGELDALRSIVMNSVGRTKGNKGSIEYKKDYGSALEGVRYSEDLPTFSTDKEKYEYAIKTTLGQASWHIDEKGHLIVEDTYNFNDAAKFQKQYPTPEDKIGHVATLTAQTADGKLGTYGLIRKIAALYGSSEGAGAKFKIDLGPVPK